MSAILPVRSWLPVAMATGLVGCIYPQPREEGPDTATPPGAGPSIYDVVGGGVQDGNRVILRDAVVSSPILPDGSGFYAQAPAGGASSGIAVRVVGGVELPPLEPGDRVELNGVAHAVGGRFEVWLSSASALTWLGPGEAPLDTLTTRPVDWDPWVGARIALSDLTAIGCPDADGATRTDVDLAIGGPWSDARLQQGDVVVEVLGTVGAVGAVPALWPWDAADVVVPTPSDGCSVSVLDARTDRVKGQVVLPAVVVTAGPTDDDQWWVQDVGGGAISGLAVLDPSGALDEAVVGDLVRLEGLLGVAAGRDALVAAGADILGPSSTTTDPIALPLDRAAPWIGALVSVGPLTVGAPSGAEAWTTSAGLPLDLTLAEGHEVEEGVDFIDVAGILDQLPGGGLVLLPRSVDDLVPGGPAAD